MIRTTTDFVAKFAETHNREGESKAIARFAEAIDNAQMPIGALRVQHYPQIPCGPFIVPVFSVQDGVRIMDMLAEYDRFQLDAKIKPDYSSATCLLMFDGEEWCDWYDDATGADDPREFVKVVANV